jgi:hypothetical protein
MAVPTEVKGDLWVTIVEAAHCPFSALEHNSYVVQICWGYQKHPGKDGVPCRIFVTPVCTRERSLSGFYIYGICGRSYQIGVLFNTLVSLVYGEGF